MDFLDAWTGKSHEGVSGNRAGAAGAAALADALKVNSTITMLDLAGWRRRVCEPEIWPCRDALCCIFHTTTVNSGRVAENEIYAAGAVALAEALRVNTAVIKISLAGGWHAFYLRDTRHELVAMYAGSRTLGQWRARMKNFPQCQAKWITRCVQITGNRIGTQAAASLVDMLKENTTLTHIELRRA